MRAASRAGGGAAGVACLALLAGSMAASDAAASSPGQRGAQVDTTSRHVVFTISSDLVTESSSLAVSTTHPGLVYTTNDSGDGATVYVLDTSTGELVGTTRLTGVAAVDFEALAIGTDGTLVIGDIGDNHHDRGDVVAYKIAQPRAGESAVTPDAVTLTYADGPRDAESLLYDAGTGQVFVASKLLGGAKVYRSPRHVFDRSRARLRPRAAAPAIATDATFVRGQRFAVIRTYFVAVVYRYPSWRRVTGFDLPIQPQGESVAAPPGGRALWIGSEGVDSRVLRVVLPGLDAGSGGSPQAPTTTTTTRIETTVVESPRREQMRSIAWVVLGAAGVALVVVIGLGLLLHRRRGRDAPSSPRERA